MKHLFSQIETQSIGKQYRGQWILKNVSTRCESGTVTLLLGPNGAGKSTLLWILSTLLQSDQGMILYDGLPKNNIRHGLLRANIGMLTHESWCYPHLTALENLIFFGSLYQSHSAQIKTSALQLLLQVELDTFKDRPVQTFSRGMLQRLALAKTFLHNPSIVLLDEPYTGVDQKGKNLVNVLIKQAKSQGAIVILATHDLVGLANFCDQAVVLSQGKIFREEKFASVCTEALLAALTEGAL